MHFPQEQQLSEQQQLKLLPQEQQLSEQQQLKLLPQEQQLQHHYMLQTSYESELFISIKDMRETMLPGVNLTSNRWLFQHLTYSLDRRMLAMLAKTDHITISGDISFNLNVSTLLSQEFLAFDDAVPASRRGHMVVELENLDIFSDLEAYTFAREFVQERGYRICVDGLTHQTITLVDRKRLGADLIKLIWHSDMVDGGKDIESDLRTLVRRAGENRVVLCRCDDREAVDFGRAIGIGLFQGRHIEHLIAKENRKRDLRRLKARIQNNRSQPARRCWANMVISVVPAPGRDQDGETMSAGGGDDLVLIRRIHDGGGRDPGRLVARYAPFGVHSQPLGAASRRRCSSSAGRRGSRLSHRRRRVRADRRRQPHDGFMAGAPSLGLGLCRRDRGGGVERCCGRDRPGQIR